MPFVPLATSEVDAKSPLDDNLMGKIKDNFDYLNTLISGAAVFLEWEVIGAMRRLYTFKRSLGAGKTTQAFTPSACRVSLRKSGISGTLALDLRTVVQTKTPITGIDFQFDGATQSIANVAPALATQSITRLTAQISTQSISVAKSTMAIQSIIAAPGTNIWRYNFLTAVDSDWVVGKSILVSGASSGGNNGTFTILEVNQSGFPSVTVSNASGVAQTGVAGTVQLQLFSYNQLNPVAADFVAGESALFASHTTGANNGTFEIYKTNQAGNNIWVFNATGAAQAGVAGTVDVQRFRYAFLSAPSTTDFIVGEKAKNASHSSANNNGNFTIVAVNALSIDMYNAAGVTQGGVAGTVNTNRWIYSLSVDPSSQISVGTNLQLESHTTAANNGEFVTKEVKRLTLNNVVIYNEAGVAQAGVAGNTRTSRKLIKFSSDQSATYSINDYIEMIDTNSPLYWATGGRAPYQVVEVNRGGGANFNVVVEAYGNPSQASPVGFVLARGRTIFVTKPSISVDLTGLSPNEFVFQEFSDFVGTLIPTNTSLELYVTSTPLGDARDLTVNLQ